MFTIGGSSGLVGVRRRHATFSDTPYGVSPRQAWQRMKHLAAATLN